MFTRFSVIGMLEDKFSVQCNSVTRSNVSLKYSGVRFIPLLVNFVICNFGIWILFNHRRITKKLLESSRNVSDFFIDRGETLIKPFDYLHHFSLRKIITAKIEMVGDRKKLSRLQRNSFFIRYGLTSSVLWKNTDPSQPDELVFVKGLLVFVTLPPELDEIVNEITTLNLFTKQGIRKTYN